MKRELTEVQGPLTRHANESDIASAARELVEQERSRQGLPPKISDPAVIAKISTLLQPSVEE